MTCSFLWVSLYLLTRNSQTFRFTREWLQKTIHHHRGQYWVDLILLFWATIYLNLLSVQDYLFWKKLTWWAYPIGISTSFLSIHKITSEQYPCQKKPDI
jgi:hypothetical protein